ncbi:hypothetical protein C2S53_004315 [Perilla frutescens var. hirtella]|uniref:F-box domain-containing protein n=1 Tax=Perilla frutescens var. hirtella TaxID=608512 RepID=A0AAD4IP60_PERFH|nr:hypothetical protein C2S53_004315 [Perilla frutescens var. hirtella]
MKRLLAPQDEMGRQLDISIDGDSVETNRAIEFVGFGITETAGNARILPNCRFHFLGYGRSDRVKEAFLLNCFEEMTGSKSSEPEDRLSELPDSLIFEIFGFLPTVDVVRTTVLSNRWKNLWTTTPNLTFNDTMMGGTDKARNFINGALKLWRGIKLLKFSVHLCEKLEMSMVSDINSWVRFATEKEVEDLCLDLTFQDNQVMCWVPQCLYSCSSLKALSLVGCFIYIQGGLQWNQLKSLKIDNDWLKHNIVNQILCSCPQLEVLSFSVYESNDSLNVQSSSLKELTIEKYIREVTEQSMVSELTIWAPNLEKLHMSGAAYNKYFLQNVSSLTHVTLGFYGPIRYVEPLTLWNDILSHRLLDIFPSIQHVEKVTLSDWCFQVLGTMKRRYLPLLLPNVTCLEVCGCFLELKQMVRLLEMLPKLKMLVLVTEEGARYPNLPEIRLKCRKRFLKSFLRQLRSVEVRWTRGDTSFYALMELLLRQASQLQQVVFRKRMDLELEVTSYFYIRGTAGEKTEILNYMKS